MATTAVFIICLVFISSWKIPIGSVKGFNMSSLVSEQLYNELFPHKDDPTCPAKGFFTYQSFIEATNRFPEFGNTGCLKTRKREIAAFLAQVSHETRARSPPTTDGDGPYDWGICIKEEANEGSYYGRGGLMLTFNFNYVLAGEALGYDILHYPSLVSSNSILAYETALWIWMNQPLMPNFNIPAPTCHDVMIGRYKLTPEDKAANRTIGYGLVTNIITSIIVHPECDGYSDQLVKSRVEYYKRFAALFDVKTGPNLDCFHQKVYFLE